MLIIHDCLRILKILSKHSPLEAVYLGVDNLYLQNGRVKLCDPFLSRSNLLQELIKLKADQFEQQQLGQRPEPHSSPRRGAIKESFETVALKKQWQLQNLFFIGLLASRLLTLRTETDPVKILRD